MSPDCLTRNMFIPQMPTKHLDLPGTGIYQGLTARGSYGSGHTQGLLGGLHPQGCTYS